MFNGSENNVTEIHFVRRRVVPQRSFVKQNREKLGVIYCEEKDPKNTCGLYTAIPQ
jgi:hypothetical protein